MPPAGIRPDPDLFIRQFLLMHREEGIEVARLLSSIEGYRLLLGGASIDFAVTPKEDFDATSLLANLKVTGIICEGLINPGTSYATWETILPYGPDEWDSNIRFLIQRISGVPSTTIAEDAVTQLKEILDLSDTNANYELADYVNVCVAIATDGETLHL